MEPNETKTPFPVKIKNLLRSKRFLVITAVSLAVVAIVASLIVFWPRSDETAYAEEEETTIAPTPESVVSTDNAVSYDLQKPFELVPYDTDENGIGADTGYHIILSDHQYTADELSSKITISPETEFSISKKAENEYTLTPLSSLKPKQVYSIDFSDKENSISYSWAFQTRDDFYVTATLPRHQATYVPVNTGIEVTFSQKEMNDLSEYFEISPQTEGRFEIHKNTVAFVPTYKLAYDTIYTITVKTGFSQKNGLSLSEDTVFSFQTEPEPDPYKDNYSCLSFDFARSIYNLYPYETPAISFYTNIDPGVEVEFSLYRYNSEDDFRNDIYINDDRPYWCISYNRPENIEGKELVLTTKSLLQREEENEEYYYNSTGYLLLPESLPEGYYIAVAKADGMERRAYVQINGMAVYVGTAVNKTIGFVYESETSSPVEGAEIVFDNFTMTTGQDGVASSDQVLFDNDGYQQKNYAVKREGHPTYFSTVGDSYYSNSYYYGDYGFDYYSIGGIRDDLWGYVFTDREMYLPSDTINIWGMLSGKDGNTAPEKVTVKLSSDQGYNENNYSLIDEREVAIAGPNTFKTSFSFENLSDGYYHLSVESDGRTLLGKGININQYEKPIYTMETTLDKQNVVYGEQVQFGIETKFFEGTPVNGMNFNYNVSGLTSQKESGILKTDINGQAKLELSAISDNRSWRPYSVRINVSNADPEETALYDNVYFTLFPRDTMIKVESSTDDSLNCAVNIKTNKINIDGIRNKDWYSESDYIGEKADVDMAVNLYETYYTATQTGTYYDFINKTTYPKYNYEFHENLIQSYQISTLNGEASFGFVKEDLKGYYITINCNDGNGMPVFVTENLYDARYYDSSPRLSQTDSYYLETDKDDYTSNFTGDVVKASLYCNKELCVKDANKKVLYMLFRKGMLDYLLTDETTFTFNLLKDYIPNVGVMAVYFDGKNMKSTPMNTIHYNEEANRLKIKVVPSSNEYSPGDTAKLDVQVTDPSGNGRSAEVLLSIVDEAYFALWGQSVSLLYDIYSQSVSIGYLGGSIPHSNTLEDYRNFEGGEGGEGGDESAPVRSEFKDTALFETVTTDSNGHGEISFKLPDNLTKWRVTYQGLTEDLYAGEGTLNIDTRLPYFINTVFSGEFITGDKPVIQLRSFGSSVVEGEKVDYAVEVEKDGLAWNKYSTSSTIGERAYIELDTLEEGTYSYTATGTYSSYKDAVKYEFEVLQGFIEQSRTQYDSLTEKIVFPEIKWPANVYFFNTNVRSYWSDLIDLSYSWSKRIDSIIVRKQARTLLEEYFGESWWYTSKEYDLKNYQLSNGGIALLPYDSANPVLTAKICSMGDKEFDYDSMERYFNGILSSDKSTSTDVAASYWGLACLREPVLLELNALAANQDLPVADRLYIGLAYAYIGDVNSAAIIYQEIAQKYLKEDTLRAYISVDNENYDSDDIQEATSLCALLAQKINAPQCRKLFSYVSNMYGQDILTNAMRLVYIKSGLKSLNMESSFTYEIDGKKETATIKGIGMVSMFLTSDKLSDIKFSDIKGDISVATVYKAPIGEISATDSRVSIERSYCDSNGKSMTTFDPSGYMKVILKIKFDPTAPTGCYMVEDYLPASFRYASSNNVANEWLENQQRMWYPHEVSGQKVSFYIYHNNLGSEERTVEYFARAVNIGEYTADCAAVFNLESNVIGYSPRAKVIVK